MKKNRIIKRISTFLLTLLILFNSSIPVSAVETLDDRDGPFTINAISVDENDVGDIFQANLFKKDQVIYVDYISLMQFADMKRVIASSGDISSFTRSDNGAVYTVGETITFDGVTYYPLIEAATRLCINLEYTNKNDILIAVPTKNIYELKEYTAFLEKNKVYQLYEWRNAKYFDADTSKKVSKIFDIGRNLFTLPTTIFNYYTGNVEAEHYRSALWNIMLPSLDQNIYGLGDIDSFLNYMEVVGLYGDMTTDLLEKGSLKDIKNSKGAMITSGIGYAVDIAELFQLQDVYKELQFSYNLANINSSVLNGIQLIKKTGVGENYILRDVIDDTLDLYDDGNSIIDIFKRNLGEGAVEAILGILVSDTDISLSQLAVGLTDAFGEWISKEGYAPSQIESVFVATANLEIQDTARKSYKQHRSLCKSTKSLEREINSLRNMRDSMLVYMLAGHNAWTALSSEKNKPDNAKLTALTMEKDIADLLQYNDMDFNIYQSSYNAVHSILAEYKGRKGTAYKFRWDEDKATNAGGIDFTLNGMDKNGESLFYKYSFSHLYYLQNGLFVGRIRDTDADSHYKMVELREIDGYCEIVLKPKNAGTSLADIDLTLEVNFDMWDGDLSQYLETDSDGSEYYRIPIPLGSEAVTPTPTPQATPSVSAENVYEHENEYATYRLAYDTSKFYLRTASLSNAFVLQFPPEICDAIKVADYTSETINIDDTYYSFDYYYNQTIAGYTLENNELTSYVSASDVKELNLGKYTVKYFDIDYLWADDSSIPLTTNRHYYIELGNGEAFFGQSNMIDRYAEKSGIYFEDFMKGIFGNIEIIPKADAPKVPVDGIFEYSTDIADYKITYDSTLVRVAQDSQGLFISYKPGIPYMLDENLRNIFYFTDSYATTNDYFKDRKDFYNKYMTDISISEIKELKLGEYTLYYTEVSYSLGNGSRINNMWDYYINLGNGEGIFGTERMIYNYGDEIGLTTEELFKKAFMSIKITSK